jgi:signal transduction histidine kinase
MLKRIQIYQYSLRSRLMVLAGFTFSLCAGVILLFFPLVDSSLEGLMDRGLRTMRGLQEVEATTLARLMVLEFSQWKELLKVSPHKDQPFDQHIKNVIWEKVTFNKIIEGIELISGQPDAQGRRLTYLFYRREAPELKPMPGPQKVLKAFSGLEADLLDALDQQQRIDKTLLTSVNLGPKQEGEMMLRYMPVHILLPDEGAVYWGVAKIGVDISGIRYLMQLAGEEQGRIRRIVWLEMALSLALSGLLALGLLYLWVRNLTEPLKNLSAVAGDLTDLDPADFDVWLENLRRVNAEGQAEVARLQDTLMRLGLSVPRLGNLLIDGARQGCLARVAARALAQSETAPESGGAAARLEVFSHDFQALWPQEQEAWQLFDPAPELERAWRLAALGLTPDLRADVALGPLPPLWGSPRSFALAVLYLLDFALSQTAPPEALSLAAQATAAGEVQVTVQMSGPEWTLEDCQRLLQPFQDVASLHPYLGPGLVAAMAAQHGGRLELTSLDGGGLAFTLNLPEAQTHHASPGPLL